MSIPTAVREKIDTINRQLNQEIENSINEAYERGYRAGLGVKIPTQKDFNQDHKEPREYGDEGEWLIIGIQYDEETALKRIQEHIREVWGNSDDEVPTSVYKHGLGYGNYGDDPPGYVIDISGNTPTHVEGWVADTQ